MASEQALPLDDIADDSASELVCVPLVTRSFDQKDSTVNQREG
jgi:hypothetical protein